MCWEHTSVRAAVSCIFAMERRVHQLSCSLSFSSLLCLAACGTAQSSSGQLLLGTPSQAQKAGGALFPNHEQ